MQLLRWNMWVLLVVGLSVFHASKSEAQAVANGSFEAPEITASVISSVTSPDWLFDSYTGGAGTTANGGPFMAGSPSTPYGTRVMYIQGVGYARQSIFASTASTCTVTFIAEQRFYNQDPIGIRLQLELDSSLVWSGIPVKAGFTTYTTSPFSVSAGAHYLSFHALNPAGNDNTVFIDAVTASCTPTVARALGNGDFETPSVGVASYQYAPTGATWTFASGGGIASNGSGFTSLNPNAPNGAQVAFLQMAGYMTQTTTVSAGTYTIHFKAAQRANNLGVQYIRVLVDGVVVGAYRPPGPNYLSYQTSPFTISNTGNHTVRLEGAGNGGIDYTALIDDVQIQPIGTFWGFTDQGFVTPKWRTGYDQTNLGTAANPAVYGTCPFITVPCPSSPTTWAGAGNAFSLNLSTFSETRYWLLVNNNEPAYNVCNTGAPDTSLPRYSPGAGGPFGSAPVMDTAAGENFYRAHLVMNFNFGNPCGAASAIPYMAIGGHANRGNKSGGGTSYNLAALNPTAGVPHSVGFTSKLFAYATPTAAAFRLMTVATWPNASGIDTQRMLFVNMLHQTINDSSSAGPGKMDWNWPITANTYYPGAEVAYFDAEDVRTLCGFDVFQVIAGITGSTEVHYDIDVNELYRCASRQTGTGLIRGFSNAMPSTANIPVTMIDWAVEGQSESGYIWQAVSNMHTH